MSRLQNTFFKSKLLKAINSAIVCSEEVDFRVIQVHSTNNTIYADRIHNEVDKLRGTFARQKPCKTKTGINTLTIQLQLEIQMLPPCNEWLFTIEYYSLDI